MKYFIARPKYLMKQNRFAWSLNEGRRGRGVNVVENTSIYNVVIYSLSGSYSWARDL
jgi:hypothetical protein